MRRAVVLGAGGAPAWAFHLGVIRGIERFFGAGLDTVDLAIGTSAGSIVAAAARCGASPDHILEQLMRPPTEAERERYRTEVARVRRQWWRRTRPLAWRLGREVGPGGRGLGLAAAGVFPAGPFPLGDYGRFPPLDRAGWPSGLWLPSVRVPSGETVVFGRDRHDADLVEAIQASSAVPGLFAPVRIGGDCFVDGATASPTHADLALEIEPEVVIVSSVQSRAGLRPSRLAARRRLDDEVSRIVEAETKLVLIEPSRVYRSLFEGFPRKNPAAAPAILNAADRLTRRLLDAELG